MREARMAERNYRRSAALHAEIAEARRDALVRCVKAGIPGATVAKTFGVSRQYVSNLIREAS